MAKPASSAPGLPNKDDEKPPKSPAVAPTGDDDDDEESVDGLTAAELQAELKKTRRELKALERKAAEAGISKGEARSLADEIAKQRESIDKLLAEKAALEGKAPEGEPDPEADYTFIDE